MHEAGVSPTSAEQPRPRGTSHLLLPSAGVQTVHVHQALSHLHVHTHVLACMLARCLVHALWCKHPASKPVWRMTPHPFSMQSSLRPAFGVSNGCLCHVHWGVAHAHPAYCAYLKPQLTCNGLCVHGSKVADMLLV